MAFPWREVGVLTLLDFAADFADFAARNADAASENTARSNYDVIMRTSLFDRDLPAPF